MDHTEFMDSVSGETPPAGLDTLVEALWWEKKGDWDRAHQIAQSVHTADGSWVHAYLHRVEGDLWNARYWYDRAGRPEGKGPPDEEREILVRHFLNE